MTPFNFPSFVREEDHVSLRPMASGVVSAEGTTLAAAGRPILHTSLSLIGGLMALTMSGFMPIIHFGVLVSLAIATTTVGALVVLPAMLSFR